MVGGDGHLVQRFRVDGREFPQWQTENRFSQSNAHICQRMLAWAHAQLGGAGGTGSRRSDDLLELYCGNGSFSLPLAVMSLFSIPPAVQPCAIRGQPYTACPLHASALERVSEFCLHGR